MTTTSVPFRQCAGCGSQLYLSAVGKRKVLLCAECAWWASEALVGWRRKLSAPDLGLPRLQDINKRRSERDADTHTA